MGHTNISYRESRRFVFCLKHDVFQSPDRSLEIYCVQTIDVIRYLLLMHNFRLINVSVARLIVRFIANGDFMFHLKHAIFWPTRLVKIELL